jgi:hypothetical protein
MATTSCDTVSGEALVSNVASHTAEGRDDLDVRSVMMTLQAFRARSDARSKAQVETRIKAYQQNCSKGETVLMSGAWSVQVKELCDFSKSIVTIGSETMCMMK